MSRSALTRHALQKSLRGQSAQDQPPEETQRRVKQDELPMYVLLPALISLCGPRYSI